MCILKPDSQPTVLIIDDTPMVISSLSRILLPFYDVKVANNGDKGLKLAQEHHIDLILLDINMPGITGFEVLEDLSSMSATENIPVIIITGSDQSADEEYAFFLGVVDYIRKPFVGESVLDRVGKHIKRGSSGNDG